MQVQTQPRVPTWRLAGCPRPCRTPCDLGSVVVRPEQLDKDEILEQLTAKGFAKDAFINQEQKLVVQMRNHPTVDVVLAINYAD